MNNPAVSGYRNSAFDGSWDMRGEYLDHFLIERGQLQDD
jgi:hypothetical protein